MPKPKTRSKTKNVKKSNAELIGPTIHMLSLEATNAPSGLAQAARAGARGSNARNVVGARYMLVEHPERSSSPCEAPRSENAIAGCAKSGDAARAVLVRHEVVEREAVVRRHD